MSKPLFSIVIPTRNRAHLLQWSLQSALNQDFPDYEIVVNNNNCLDQYLRQIGAAERLLANRVSSADKCTELN